MVQTKATILEKGKIFEGKKLEHNKILEQGKILCYKNDGSETEMKTGEIEMNNENKTEIKAAGGEESELEMAKILLLQGQGCNFFFVEVDKSSQSDVIVRVGTGGKVWPVFKGAQGKILALEFDEDGEVIEHDHQLLVDTKKTAVIDSKWTERGKKRKLVRNSTATCNKQLYVIDSLPSLTKLRSCGNLLNDEYQAIQRWSLEFINELSSSLLEEMSHADFSRCIITDRCVTVNGEAFVYESGCKFDALPAPTLEDGWSVCESRQVQNCDREFHSIVSKSRTEFAFAIKTNPASRKCPLFGLKSQRDVKQLIHISPERFLIQLTTDPSVEKEFYWTLMDQRGKVHKMEPELEERLTGEEWTHRLTL